MAAEKTSTPKPNKSESRSPSAELSAEGVVERAKAPGVTVTAGPVHGARRQSKAKRKTKTGAAQKSSAGKKSAAPTSPTTSKADFVRRFPKASPKEVIAKAHAEGIQIDLDYLYKVRSSDRLGKLKTKAETRPASPRMGVSVPRPTATASSAEDVLKAVAAEIGLGRAIEILAGERTRVRALIGR
jgi:hypothetical protein